MSSRFRVPARRTLVLAAVYGAVLAVPASAPAQPPETWGALEVPLDAVRARETLSLGHPDGRLDATLLLDFTRRWGNLDLTAAAARFEQLLATEAEADAALRLPLPLPGFWHSHVFSDRRPAIASLVRNRRAVLTYTGLLALDDRTLAWLDDRHDVVRAISADDVSAAAFAAFGSSLQIDENGSVRVPGGADAEEVWTTLTGRQPSDAAAFVTAMLAADGGRLAWFYDTIAALSPQRQRFALALDGDPAARLAAVRRVYERFRAVEPAWRIPARPFHRPPFDAGLVLMTVDITPAGTVGPDWWPPLLALAVRGGDWTARVADISATPTVRADAAWLVEWVFERPDEAERRYAALRLLQRSFADVPVDLSQALHDVVAAAVEMPALAASLQRTGLSSPQLHATVARAARRLTWAGGQSRVSAALGRWQACLALLEQVQRTRRLPAEVVDSLLEGLAELVAPGGSLAPGGTADWVEQLAAAVAALPTSPVEGGVPHPISEDLFVQSATAAEAHDDNVIAWEGLDYEITPERAAAASALAVRRAGGGPELESLIELNRIRRALTAGDLAAHSGLAPRLRAMLPVFADLRWMDRTMAGNLDYALERAGDAGERLDRELPLLHAAADLLVDAIVPPLVYALAVSPTPEPVLFADAWRRHELTTSSGPAPHDLPPWQRLAWQFATDYGLGGGTRLVGSWLGLDVALAHARLVRLVDDSVPVPGIVDPRQRAALVETLALRRPNPSVDVRAAIRRGREQVATWAAEPPAPAELARQLRAGGVDPWRANVIAWATADGRTDALETLSVTETFWLGGGSSGVFTSTSSRLIDGCLCPLPAAPVPIDRLVGRRLGIQAFRPADVEIRLLEVVADLGLDGRLVPLLMPMAVQDWLDRSQPAWFDDFDAFTLWPHALTVERVEAYLLHLLTSGTLSPPAAEVEP